MEYNQNLAVEIIWYSLDKTDKEIKSGEAMTKAILAYEQEVKKTEKCKFFSSFGHEITCNLSKEELQKIIPVLLGELTDKIKKVEN